MVCIASYAIYKYNYKYKNKNKYKYKINIKYRYNQVRLFVCFPHPDFQGIPIF